MLVSSETGDLETNPGVFYRRWTCGNLKFPSICVWFSALICPSWDPDPLKKWQLLRFEMMAVNIHYYFIRPPQQPDLHNKPLVCKWSLKNPLNSETNGFLSLFRILMVWQTSNAGCPSNFFYRGDPAFLENFKLWIIFRALLKNFELLIKHRNFLTLSNLMTFFKRPCCPMCQFFSMDLSI